MNLLRRVGILGGTFDPVHAGHLAAAAAAREALRLNQVWFMPDQHPGHRSSTPVASGYHRFAMAALAIADHADYVASDLELVSESPSFTATTLRRLHAQGYAAVELFFIVGSDAFAEIAAWRDYPGVLGLCHFAVISRPTLTLQALCSRLPALASRMRTIEPDRAALDPGEAEAAPSVFLVQRDTPDVSSTEIRTRIRKGRRVTGMVPAAVEAYIARHGLYRAHA